MSGRRYTHLEGSYHAPRALLLQRLNRLAAYLKKPITINSGRRSLSEQASLYANRASNPYPVAPPTPNDPHIEGVAVDASVGGQPIQDAVPAATLRKFGLEGLSGDAVHIQIAGTVGKSATQIREMAKKGAFGERARPSGGGGGGFDPLGTVGNAAGDAAGLVAEGAGLIGGAAGDVTGELLGGLVGDVLSHAEALMLNMALVGGGAFLVYYGAALMLGVRKPVATPAKAAAVIA